MLPTQYLARSNISAVDEARPRGRNKRFFVRKDTKPRLFVPSSSSSKRYSSSKRHPFKTASSPSTTSQMNAVVWMQNDCPLDVLPMILAYAGPQMAQTLSKTNQFWNQVLNEEATWRQLCEELYKWKVGDALPLRGSWKAFYRDTPCVPTDYPSIAAALAIASDRNEAIVHDICNMNPRVMEQRRSIRIQLRPGDYYLKEAICIQAVGPHTTVAIETMNMPQISPIPKDETDASMTHSSSVTNMSTSSSSSTSSVKSTIRQRASNLRRTLSCRSLTDIVQDVDMDHFVPSVVPSPPTRATLISKSRRSNEPILRVRQGTARLTNINICHNSHGVDIWNGNAAIQIQPALGPDDHPLMTTPSPRCLLDGVDVTSKSGRGIVNIDGGIAVIRRCYVHDCAATGIYVGGPGSNALIERTDVTHNGNGNRQRRGIARGHSGIYLEQGKAVVRDCNISQNSLTGISAVSQENAILSLEESDLIANGAQQLEMPPNGSLSRRRSLTRDNTMATEGLSRSRSGLIEG